MAKSPTIVVKFVSTGEAGSAAGCELIGVNCLFINPNTAMLSSGIRRLDLRAGFVGGRHLWYKARAIFANDTADPPWRPAELTHMRRHMSQGA